MDGFANVMLNICISHCIAKLDYVQSLAILVVNDWSFHPNGTALVRHLLVHNDLQLFYR